MPKPAIIVKAQLSNGKELIATFVGEDRIQLAKTQEQDWEISRQIGEEVEGSPIASIHCSIAMVDDDDYLWERLSHLEPDFKKDIDRLLSEMEQERTK